MLTMTVGQGSICIRQSDLFALWFRFSGTEHRVDKSSGQSVPRVLAPQSVVAIEVHMHFHVDIDRVRDWHGRFGPYPCAFASASVYRVKSKHCPTDALLCRAGTLLTIRAGPCMWITSTSAPRGTRPPRPSPHLPRVRSSCYLLVPVPSVGLGWAPLDCIRALLTSSSYIHIQGHHCLHQASLYMVCLVY